MDKKVVGKNVRELKKLARAKEEIEKRMEFIKNNIKGEMTKENIDEIAGDDYKVTWKWVHSDNFDTKRFKAEHEKLAKRYMKGSNVRKFVYI